MGNSTTLMDKARALLTRGVGVGIAVLPLSSAAEASTPKLTLLQALISFGTGGTYSGPQGMSGLLSPDGTSVKLSGFSGPGPGSIWTPAFSGPMVFSVRGNNEVLPEHGDFLHIDYNFDVEFTGGQVEWVVFSSQRVRYSASPSDDFEQIRVSALGTLGIPGEFEISDGATGTPYDSEGRITFPTGNIWSMNFTIDWKGFQPNDTIEITIPSSGINLYYNVPETSAALLCACGVSASLLPRRRRACDASKL